MASLASGTAKSELSRRLNAVVGGSYFERLLTRFSVPEELFGPLSMRGLENDEYVRQIGGYLPTAEVRQPSHSHHPETCQYCLPSTRPAPASSRCLHPIA